MYHYMHDMNDMLNMRHQKLNHTNLFMNKISSFVLTKFKFVLVEKKKKRFFGDKNLDLCLSHKNKVFLI